EPGKRVFIIYILYHLVPPIHIVGVEPRSLQHLIVHVVFLIRKLSSSIPSLYRCFVSPLSDQTDLHDLDSTEPGDRELRILLDYLYSAAAPPLDASLEGNSDKPLLIDVDDFLAHPDAVVRSLCAHLSIPYSPSMLRWDSSDDRAYTKSLFDKFAGYHDDALNSMSLNPNATQHEGSSPNQGKRKTNDGKRSTVRILRR
ncbi:MAG: hypothetical protein LQ352_007956, partial [Teloschistes flavicans]